MLSPGVNNTPMQKKRDKLLKNNIINCNNIFLFFYKINTIKGSLIIKHFII